MLGKWLKQNNYAFWNLGHPPRKVSMRYKADLGGKVYSRSEFLTRWRQHRDIAGANVLETGVFTDKNV